MYRFIKNDDGIALMMVLILLILVGGLTATLMAAGVFNIRFGVDEVDRTKSFYAADAGVEYTKNTLTKMVTEDKIGQLEDKNSLGKSLDQNESDFLVNDERKISIGDSSFNVKLIGNSDNSITFESTGFYNGAEEKIEFSFDVSLFYEAAVLLNNPGNKTKDQLTDWAGGQSGEFSYSNIALLKDLEDWWDFLTENGYIEHDGKAVTDYKDFIKIDLKQINSDDDLEDFYEGLDEEYLADKDKDKLFFSPTAVEMDGEPDTWVEGAYDEFEVVKEEVDSEDYDYYYANQDITDEMEDYNVKPSDSDYWTLIDDDTDLTNLGLRGGVTIEDKIIIVNGSLDVGRTDNNEENPGGGALGNITFRNSLVLVRNNAMIGGRTILDNSLIIAFDDDGSQEDILTVRGANSIKLTLVSDIDEEWHGIEELFENIEGAFADIAEMNYWRQSN